MKVSVRTSSRLHFAMLDLRGDLGRKFGSLGVAIDNPSIQLTVEPSDSLFVEGSRTSRALYFAEKILENYRCEGSVHIKIDTDIPEHSGFGSGTQLALAIGMAISKIYDLGCTEEEISIKLGRSQRSGIGTYAFKHGGFIVDGGHRIGEIKGIPPLLFHSPVPDEWRFIIGLPEVDTTLSGDKENKAFMKVESPPTSLVAEATHIVLMQMMPAIIEENIEVFGASMTRLDSIFGGYWEKIQGGRYSHPLIKDGVDLLFKAGAHGIGQSSWGPAFYGLIKKGKADEVEVALQEKLNSEGRKGCAFTASPNNCGAQLDVR